MSVLGVSLLILMSSSLVLTKTVKAGTVSTINTWWPTDNSNISGTQPFKAVLNNWSVDNYVMYWTVDGGPLNVMPSSYLGFPHKETVVDVSAWNTRSDGHYQVSYIAQTLKGSEIARLSFTINLPVVLTSFSTVKPLQNETFYINPISNAATQASNWRTSRPDDAAMMDKLAESAVAEWFGGWNYNIRTDVQTYVTAAANTKTVPVLVAYNIPQRDCDGYSAGGSSSADSYINWINNIAAGVGARKALIVLEPDALANIDCLAQTDQSRRLNLINQAVTILKANPGTMVYLDGGNPRWQSPEIMAARLKSANVAKSDGFSLNVSNFITTTENTNYGGVISEKLSNKHFVIDTSRNGLGPASNYEWCNPLGRAIGPKPTTLVNSPLVDAYLWIKTPGESDGQCNGGSSAGSWWPDYALGLVRRASY